MGGSGVCARFLVARQEHLERERPAQTGTRNCGPRLRVPLMVLQGSRVPAAFVPAAQNTSVVFQYRDCSTLIVTPLVT